MPNYGPARLKRRGPSSPGHANHWWVSRVDLDKRAKGDMFDAEYLRADGTWHQGMDTTNEGCGVLISRLSTK